MLERWSHLPTYKRRRAERHADAPQKEATVVQGPPDTVRVRDVYVPTKPAPPGPEECCQSGCVNCVYVLYADNVDEHKRAMRDIRRKLRTYDPPIREDEWDTTLLGPMPNAPDTQDDHDHVDEAAPADPSLAAFLELERKLKKK